MILRLDFFYFVVFLFFFNDTATTEIYTLSLHDALPIRLTGCMPSRCVSARTAACRTWKWPAVKGARCETRSGHRRRRIRRPSPRGAPAADHGLGPGGPGRAHLCGAPGPADGLR